ncbi:MAG: exodeoxyribonuclease V subunit beta [Azoarcus sp.]|jgi:exodeoxyribonuclease V beta subunit|nr:exodeoxyribonuclease V subunit beta [Azoarcus sp.]
MAPASSAFDVFACPLDGIALIEASAGTGKTWNICGLYLRLLLEKDLPIDRLLVVTFTRAATAELSSRIRERIVAVSRALDGGEPGGDSFVSALIGAARMAGVAETAMRQRLQEALATFDEAAIFTIHGFCQRAIVDTPFASGLPYALEVGEDDSDLRLETARDFWRREVAGIDATLAAHLLACRDSPERWAQWLREAQARPLARALWDEDGGDPVAPRVALDAGYDEARRLWGGGAAVRRTLDAAAGLHKGIYNAAAIDAAFRQWTTWLAAGDACIGCDEPVEGNKLRLFSAVTLAGRTNKGHAPPEHPFFAAAQNLLDARQRFDEALEAARLRLLRRFIEEAGVELRRRKRSERRAAFDDILWNAYDALVSERQPWMAEALHARYPVALIDEFQDTDPLQLAIFQRIYDSDGRHGSLFLVGDPKQAIYSFRGADLQTYLRARALADASYTLEVNRRSAPALVAACNTLFGANGAAFMEAGLDFLPVRAHGPSHDLDDRTSSGGDAALRLWRIPRGEGGNSDEGGEGDEGDKKCGAGGERLSRQQALVRAAAASATEIARLLVAGARGEIRIGERAISPGDIAVLVRTHNEGARMKAALAQKGVGSVELSQSSVFASGEAGELERVLLAIAEPMRERLLKAALATELMGWNAVALASLADDDNGLVEQFERFAAWREDWLRHGFAFMLWRWMNDAGVASRLLARDDGERRLTNLLHLAELLQRDAGRASPAVLLGVLDRRRTEGGGDDALLRLESDRNLVRIVTIYRAKGLQYGIVFCPFLFDGHAAGARGGPMRLWHDEAGAQVADWRRAPDDEDRIAERLGGERDAETLRLIYVALTRAVHRCYLVVGCYNKGVRSESYKESAHSLLNWLVAGMDANVAAWRKKDYSPAEVDALWRRLASASDCAIALDDLPLGDGGELLALEAARPVFSAPRAPKVPGGWRLGSFSALVSGAAHESAAQDHDARAGFADIMGEPGESIPSDDDVLRFPRGPVAGDCIHAVFEAIDFTRAETRSAAIARALAVHAPTPGKENALLFRMLAKLVDDVLATPLVSGDGPALRLETVPMERRLTELGFYLPTPRLAAAALGDWLASHGYDAPKLAPRDLTAYLKGYIDLVFEHEGRYWALDWKSNYLGDAPAAYAPAALAAAMARHGYHLQHLLYTVALHRHLTGALPGYDYDRHFGGALYLFVRGVRPGWRIENEQAGVFRHRAAKAVIESLDALLAGGGSAGRPR